MACHFTPGVFTWDYLSVFWRHPLTLLLVVALLINLLLWLVARMIDLETAHRHVGWLSFLQIGLEILFITLLIYNLTSGQDFALILYLIPIIESIVLFGHFGPLLVAILIGVIQNLLIFFSHSAFLLPLFRNPQSEPDWLAAGSMFTWSLFLSLIYVIIGSLSSYIARAISEREQALTQIAKLKEKQMGELVTANRNLAKEERALKSKDYELEVANRRLEELENAKSKFVSVTAHQLRTPLSAIKWTFDMMLTGQLGQVTEEQKEFLQKGFDSTQRMIRIVNDLLRVDSIDANNLELVLEPFSLEKLVDSVTFEFSTQAQSKKIVFSVKKPPQSMPTLMGDAAKLRVVLENLIDNAIKYTPKGGRVSVVVSDAKINSATPMAEIVVTDSGIGISPTDKSKIFSKFFRAANAVRLEPDGSGIGLYMAKDIVEKHHGSLVYENAPGGGTIFRVTLPLKPVVS